MYERMWNLAYRLAHCGEHRSYQAIEMGVAGTPPLLNRIGGPFSVHEVAVSGCPSARPGYGRARRALVATRPVTQCWAGA
jgi:hypothetical protein